MNRVSVGYFMSLKIAIYLINKKAVSPALIMYTSCQQHQYIIFSLNFTWCPGWSVKSSNCLWSSWELSSWDAAVPDQNQGGNQLWLIRDKEIQCLGCLPGSPLLLRVQRDQNSCPDPTAGTDFRHTTEVLYSRAWSLWVSYMTERCLQKAAHPQ